MIITIHCSECPHTEQIEAAFENKRITARMPEKWGYLCFDIVYGKKSMDVLFCPPCNITQQAKWGNPPKPKPKNPSRAKKRK